MTPHQRLENDLWEAIALQRYDMLECVCVVARTIYTERGQVASPDDVVGWAASWIERP